MTYKIVMLLSNAFRPDPRVLKEAESLTQAGYDITIICWDRLVELPEEEILPSRVRIIRVQTIQSSYGLGISQMFALHRFWRAAMHILDQLHPDFVHCHDFDTLPAGLSWGKRHHIPVVYDAHEYYADLVKPRLGRLFGWPIYMVIRWAEKLASGMSNAVVTVDKVLAERYSQRNHQVLILGHYPQKQLADRPNHVFSRQELTMLYAGRISTDRGALLYIEVLRYLRDLDIPAELVLAGTFTPSSEEDQFKKNLRGLEPYVDYLGWIPYQIMQSVYHTADLGFSILLPVPRYVAALPVKLFEYMASGLPVVASNFPSITSIIKDTNCGIVVDPSSHPSVIAQSIARWWSEPAIPRALGENGRHAIRVKYNWESQVSRLPDLYDQIRTGRKQSNL